MSRKPPQFFISLYGWTYWLPIFVAGGLISITLVALIAVQPAGSSANLWLSLILGVVVVLTLAGLAFFRDFPRQIPNAPGLMVAPADGKVSQIITLDHDTRFGGPVLKISIFLSVLDVHVNRSPCDGVVIEKKYEEGLFLDARDPLCTEKNQSATIVLAASKENGRPIVVVKQLVGAIARRIITPVEPGDELKRGERYGMIAFGSRTELFVPNPDQWDVAVQIGQHVKGGSTILLKPKA